MKIHGTSPFIDAYHVSQANAKIPARNGVSQGDTVSLSSEAKRLLEYFRAKQFDKNTEVHPSTTEEKRESPYSGVGGSEQTAAAAGNSGQGDQIADIEKRIKDLMDKVKHIMDSDLSPEQKHEAAAPYLQQIQELQQQLQQLMTKKQKSA